MQHHAANESVWGERSTVREFAGSEGFCDPGEEVLYRHLLPTLAGASVLDLGVGAGRTVPLFASLASRYVALDFVSQMVDACRRRFPSLDVRQGDARDLRQFRDASFSVVNFSFNGIDSVNHADRQRILQEVARVLLPGGLFWFSTLNMEGLGRRMRPWKPEWHPKRWAHAKDAWREVKTLLRMPMRVRNHWRFRARFERGDGWCTDTLSAHDYALLMHYTTLPREIDELVQAGFEDVPLVLDSSFGRPVRVQDDVRDVFWFHVLARKRVHRSSVV